jgi:uncharacterized membrane protein YphA (DoxX/SURF4 family)
MNSTANESMDSGRNGSGSAWRWALLLARIALAAVFVVAAYAKMRPQLGMPWSLGSVGTSLSMFAMQVDSYQMLPASLVSAVAHFLPIFELVLGLWLLTGIGLRWSSLIATLTLGTFFTVMVRSYALHLGIACGCFGPGEQIGPKTLTRDGSLLVLALIVLAGAFLTRRGGGSRPTSGAASGSGATLPDMPSSRVATQ